MSEFTISSFFSHLSSGKLIGARCKKCENYLVPLRSVCPRCGSFDLKLFEISGDGVLETFTVIHSPPSNLSNIAPYVVGIVRFNNGSRVMSRIIGLDSTAPERIKLGTPMKLAPLREGNRIILAFKRA